MKQTEHYEEYPAWILLITNLVPMGVYLAGSFIIYQIGVIWLALYLAYIGFLEIRLLKGHCIDCYYYGKKCAFGKGKLSSVFFRKGDCKSFGKKQITWKGVLPDFMVFLIPAIIGFMVLVMDFSWLVLASVILLFVLGFAGNAFVRGSLACNHCKQRGVGCPAEQMFSKRRK